LLTGEARKGGDILEELLKKTEQFVKRWSQLFSWVGAGAIFAMLGITVTDIICSKLLNRPILGSVDLIGLLGLIVSAFALAQTEIHKQHVRIDFIVLGFKQKIQAIIGIVSTVFALVIIGMLIWQSIDYGLNLQASTLGSPTLRIPFFPFSYLIALGCIPLFLILFFELIEHIGKVRKNERN
jgi:TRAP-type C4-dicarboxylate transport system permease small subunit